MFLWLLNNVMRLKMEFFDTTPIGRVLARFSNDIFAVDVVIPALWDVLVMCTFSVRTKFFKFFLNVCLNHRQKVIRLQFIHLLTFLSKKAPFGFDSSV